MPTISDGSFVTPTALFNLFQQWHQLNARDGKLPSLRTFGASMRKILGKTKGVRASSVALPQFDPVSEKANAVLYCYSISLGAAMQH